VAIQTEAGSIHYREHEPFLAASLIKIPIMIEAYRQVQAGRLDLYQLYKVPFNQRVGGSGVLFNLGEEIHVSLQDLISLMIMISDNTATNFIIDQIGIDTVNDLASELKCDQTMLGRKLMDYTAKKRGFENFTSAYDMVHFFKEMVEGNSLHPEYKRLILKSLRAQQFQSKLPGKILDDLGEGDFIAHKTGEMTNYEHDAGILSVGGKVAYIAVLTSDGPDAFTRRTLIADIGKAVFDFMKRG
jgi:beta-lactamase class A